MVRLESERITVVGGVPTQWAKVVDHPAPQPPTSPRSGSAQRDRAPPERSSACASASVLGRRPLRDDRVAVDHGHRAG
jgi:acyl-CoA synthetase (AMP-forming)/AMP-acid ligase II